MGKKTDYSLLDGKKDHGCCYRCTRSVCCCFYGCAKCVVGTICWIVIIAVLLGLVYLGTAACTWGWLRDVTMSIEQLETYECLPVFSTTTNELGYTVTTWEVPMNLQPGKASPGLALLLTSFELNPEEDWLQSADGCGIVEYSTWLREGDIKMLGDELYPVPVMMQVGWRCEEGVTDPNFTIVSTPEASSINLNFWEIFPAGPQTMGSMLEDVAYEPLVTPIRLCTPNQ